MAQVTITQLPTASALTGTESVPIVQNGQTVQTTTGAISGAGALNYPFLTVGSTAGLTQARYLTTSSGLSLTDNGAGTTLRINLIGTAQSLNNASAGIIVKTGTDTVTNRLIAVGTGMTIANADGISGNPTIGLTQILQNIATTSSPGLLTINGTTIISSTIAGTTNQISIANGNGVSGSPTVSIYPNPVLPGNAYVGIPSGTTAQRGSPTAGALRYNTDTASLEAYTATGWGAIVSGSGVTTFSGGTTGLTPNTPTSGGIILDGVLVPTNGGTGASTLTGYVYGNGTSTMTASTTIPTTALSGTVTNAQIANPQVTYNGVTVALGASGTITATTTQALTVSTGLQLNSGTTFDGSVARTISIDSTVATLTGSQTLTNKTISGSNNTLSNIGNSSLTNSSLTVGTTTISLGGTSLTLGGLTSVTVTQDPSSALQLATKQYVDSVAQGLDAKASCVYGTTGNITLSGLGTQGNGDWASTLTAGDRILVKNQTSSQFNGIYVASSSTWTRALDMDVWAEVPSSFVFIESGSTLADTGWVTTANAGGTIDVTPMPWVQFSGAGTYTAGTGLTLTGTQFSLTAPVTASLGGSGYTSYSTGDMLYASGSTTLSKLTIGTVNYVLTSSGSAPQYVAQSTLAVGTATNIAGGTAGAVPYNTGAGATTFLSLGTNGYVLTAGASAPTYVAQSTLSVGSATNATNTGTTLTTTGATNYIVFKTTTSGNLPELVNSSITCNAVNGTITGGISGGAF